MFREHVKFIAHAHVRQTGWQVTGRNFDSLFWCSTLIESHVQISIILRNNKGISDSQIFHEHTLTLSSYERDKIDRVSIDVADQRNKRLVSLWADELTGINDRSRGASRGPREKSWNSGAAAGRLHFAACTAASSRGSGRLFFDEDFDL